MADFFNDSDNKNERNNFGRDRDFNNNEDFSFMKDNSFDQRYSRESGRDRSRGFFDQPDRNSRRIDRKLPPIEEPDFNRGPNIFGRRKDVQPVTQQGVQQQVFPIGNVMLFSPKSYADVQTLIDHLRRHEPAIVDFAEVDNESGQRILDFLSGAIYALGGSMQRVSGTIFLLTPPGVSITAPPDIGKSIEDRRNKK